MKKEVNILIKYLVSLKNKTGRREEKVQFPAGSVLQDVADWLNKRYRLSIPNPEIMSILNGKGWNQFPLQMSTKIKEGDTICLLPPISGG